MQALVKRDAGPGLVLEEIPKPTAGPDDVLIRVLRTAICGTDVHIYQWDDWARATIPVPMAIGHEFVGEIVEVGGNVSHYSPGMLVSGEGHIACGRCRNCGAGRRHLCRDIRGVGVNRQGAFAEYIVVPSANVWRHAVEVDLDLAAIFDPFGNATHTALQWDLLGEDVLITGAGPIGGIACAIARHAGARHVVISDVNDYRLSLAEKLGATRTVNVQHERLADVRKELAIAEGYGVGLEMSGDSQALRELLDNMSHGGKVSMLGIPGNDIAIDWRKVVFNMLTIRGIYGREVFETWYKMSAMLQSGLNLLPIITHRLPYASFEQGFAAILSGRAGKVILNWDNDTEALHRPTS